MLTVNETLERNRIARDELTFPFVRVKLIQIE